MRNIVLSLIFVNLLLFVWQIWIVPPDAPDPYAYPDASIPQLAIWADTSEPADAESTSLGGADSIVADEHCVRVGPFADLAVADQVREQLLSRASEINRSSEPGEAWVGHWVQVKDLGPRADAESAVAELVQAGIADAYIVQFEPTMDISLGVYRSLERARNVVSLAGGKGYTAIMEDRVRPTVEHWLVTRLAAGETLQLGDISVASGQILRSEATACAPPDGEAISAPAVALELDGQ